MPLQFTQDGDWIQFAVKVVPGASRDRVAGHYDGGLKVTVAKVAQEGAANRAVIALLSDHLNLAKGQVEIVRGHSNPRKLVRVRGIDLEQLRSLLSE